MKDKWVRTTNGKYLLKGVGRVYNCDCTAPQERNCFHHLDCASRKNLTLTYKLSLWEQIKQINAPKGRY